MGDMADANIEDGMMPDDGMGADCSVPATEEHSIRKVLDFAAGRCLVAGEPEYAAILDRLKDRVAPGSIPASSGEPMEEDREAIMEGDYGYYDIRDDDSEVSGGSSGEGEIKRLREVEPCTCPCHNDEFMCDECCDGRAALEVGSGG